MGGGFGEKQEGEGMTKSLSGKIVCEKHQWPTKDCVLCMSAIYESEQEVGRMDARIAELEAENARLRDPDWVTYVTLTRIWLEKYPPDIFTGVSGDPGPLFVVAVRNALIELGSGE